MKTTTGFQNDWKVITIFIGRNDLCDACNDWVGNFHIYDCLCVERNVYFLVFSCNATVNVVIVLVLDRCVVSLSFSLSVWLSLSVYLVFVLVLKCMFV